MKTEKTILRKIESNENIIKKFKADKTLDPASVKNAVFTLKANNRTLKWMLK